MKNQSFMYAIEPLKPCSKDLPEYFKKLWLPTPVATIDIVISHHEKRLPPKKKSLVDLLNLAKYEPKPSTTAK